MTRRHAINAAANHAKPTVAGASPPDQATEVRSGTAADKLHTPACSGPPLPPAVDSSAQGPGGGTRVSGKPEPGRAPPPSSCSCPLLLSLILTSPSSFVHISPRASHVHHDAAPRAPPRLLLSLVRLWHRQLRPRPARPRPVRPRQKCVCIFFFHLLHISVPPPG
jgi:hypothetical protein